MQQKDTILNWSLFVLLSIIWGSSFVLMKIGLQTLSATQVAAIRIASAALLLLPFALQAFKQLPTKSRGLVLLSGLLGSFFPAFLFCLAEVRLSSALTGMINSLTPLFTVIVGVLFFKKEIAWQKWIGIAIGLVGLVLLIIPTGSFSVSGIEYVLFVVLATIMYAVNVNLVGYYLKQMNSLYVASMAFAFLLIPALGILYASKFFSLSFSQTFVWQSIAASAVLGMIGTAIASVLFYRLVKNAGPLFASMVTYGIPVVAVVWGLLYGELVLPIQFIGLAIILTGVYLVNKKV